MGAASRGYDRQWQKIRKAQLQEEPLGRFCKEQGVSKLAEHVGHINGNSRDNRVENLRPFCAKYHNARTERDQAFGRKGDC